MVDTYGTMPFVYIIFLRDSRQLIQFYLPTHRKIFSELQAKSNIENGGFSQIYGPPEDGFIEKKTPSKAPSLIT